MIRGYVTIATGKKHYYKIAANLLKSYRIHTINPLPFAIIAEEENEYTKLFDDVIITNESSHSFMDKFLLLKLCPYDENIFFDADSLAYGDLNKFWDFFKDATDFSSLGVNRDKYDTEGTWYNAEDIWKYGDLIDYKTRVHAGVLFIRKSNSLEKLYNDCIDIYNNYDKLYFHTCSENIDEAILGVAMPMNNMKAIREDPKIFGCYPNLTYIKTDMINGELSFTTEWGWNTEQSVLIHFGTPNTYDALYKFDAECIEYYIKFQNKKPPYFLKLAYEKKAKYYFSNCIYKIYFKLKCRYSKIKTLINSRVN